MIDELPEQYKAGMKHIGKGKGRKKKGKVINF